MVGVGALALAACTGGPRQPARPPDPAPDATVTVAPSMPARPVPATPPGGTGSSGLGSTDRLEAQDSLARVLPHATAHYAIDYSVGADGRLDVVVTLLAVLNDGGDLAGYQAQLRRYKAEAAAFIRAHADDPARYRVAYLPPEAAAL